MRSRPMPAHTTGVRALPKALPPALIKVLTTAVAGLVAGPVLAAGLVSADAATPGRRIAVEKWTRSAELRQGTARGLEVARGRLQLGDPVGTRGGYEYGTWRSPWVEPGFDLTELVPSWEGETPGDSWIRVDVRGRTSATASSWDTMARWALDDAQLDRRSGKSQADDVGRVAYDTWLTGGVSAWQVRVTLLRRTGGTASPSVGGVTAMASRLPAVPSVSTSRPGADDGAALGTVLPVPRYSQMVHEGSYPEYDGGGEAWCSPTSTTMVLGYYDALPVRSDYAWVAEDHPDRVVAHAARMTYDEAFGGTGNWPFNTAYAASRTGRGFVTRLRTLREAERFIASGIPLVASISFSSGQLDGAPISSTNGHLLVIVGFEANGDVVVNDPAAPTRGGVRRTYDRGQFEDAWLKRYSSAGSLRGSGGIVYVIRDAAHPLPARGRHRNW